MKKDFRVKKSQEFGAIMARKQYVSNRDYALYYCPNSLSHVRVGLSAGKKLGKAHLRNKVRRQVRMMVMNTFDFHQGCDYIIIVRKHYLSQSFEDNQKSLLYLYEKIQKRMDKKQ